MTARQRLLSTAALAVAAIALSYAIPAGARAATPQPAKGCPTAGWQEGLGQYLTATAPFPTEDTKNVPTPNCIFHQWSWEAFIWATALVKDPTSGEMVPRFLTLQTPADLLPGEPTAAAGQHPGVLRLAARAQVFHGTSGFTTGAGAIVEADGNMLVAQNGYPVYASVHMNPSYVGTAKQNLIATGGYTSQPADSSFSVGAAVFKATWLRLDDGEKAPAGAYTTKAQVPVLQTVVRPGLVTIQPVPGQFKTVTVALIGLHVVGYTENHPEFLWGTFEHRMNSPQTPDNTFTPSASTKDAKDYTLYKANTPFSVVNVATVPPSLKLDETTQKITPVTNVVLENRTGGEINPQGAGNILAITGQAQRFLAGLKSPQSEFASYALIGTVWLQANKYNLKSKQTDALGSVNLANATAETFVQEADTTPRSGWLNCFLCHNPTSYSFKKTLPKLPDRLIALSHVLAIGSPYEVPNSISGRLLLVPAIPGR